MHTLTDRTTKYAMDVKSGKIVAGKFVRLAADRHLRDLKDGHKRGLKWDQAKADKAIDFFPAVLSITEGAKEGQPFNLLPWHLFVVGSIYGWRDVNGARRFRFVWLETGKGQAKSPLMAGLGVYEIVGQKRNRAEVYAIGEDRKTAGVMFRDAVAMCRAPIPGKGEETLEGSGRVIIRGFGDNAWKIEHPASSSKFEPVANSDAISGPKPSLVLGDEIHEMKTNKAISIWRAAIAKMSGDPMMVLGTNTPSVDQHVGTTYSEYFQRVLRGENTDDSAFAYIARVDNRYTQVYSVIDALGATQRHCTCNFVPTTQTHEYIAKAYASHAISDNTEQRLSSDAKTILTERFGLATSALPASTGKTETTKSTWQKSGSISVGGLTKIENGSPSIKGSGSKTKGRDTNLTLLAADFCSFIMRHQTTLNSSLPSKVADALYALEQDKKLESFASIIAMNEILIEASSATIAIRESVCSEIISKVLSEHSDTCDLRKAILSEEGLSVDIPGDDPFNDESCWIKSLPALGITYPIENVRKEVQTARDMISTAITTKRLFFGIPVGTAGFWIDESSWVNIQGEVIEDEMIGRRLHLSLDLADKNDLTALSGCWEGDKLAVKTWYWTRETNIADRSTADQIPYRELEAAGCITVTPSPTIDFEFIAAEVQRICAKHDVVQLVFDPSRIADFITACGRIGFDVWKYDGPDEPEGVGLKLVAHAQGPRVLFEGKQLCMPISIRHFEDHILKGSIVIEKSRMTAICASNAVVVADAQKNKYYDKNKSRGRIDGLVTIAMAVGSATSEMESKDEGDMDSYFASLAGY